MEITEVRIKLMEDNSGSNERLQAFCSITFDDMFVIRDLKIIEGAKGFFVAMPSRKLTDRCHNCGTKNHLRSRFCNQCGCRLDENRALRDADGRAKLHADIAHPINSMCREKIQGAVLSSYAEELERSKMPGYVSRYDEYEADEFDLQYEGQPAAPMAAGNEPPLRRGPLRGHTQHARGNQSVLRGPHIASRKESASEGIASGPPPSRRVVLVRQWSLNRPSSVSLHCCFFYVSCSAAACHSHPQPLTDRLHPRPGPSRLHSMDRVVSCAIAEGGGKRVRGPAIAYNGRSGTAAKARSKQTPGDRRRRFSEWAGRCFTLESTPRQWSERGRAGRRPGIRASGVESCKPLAFCAIVYLGISTVMFSLQTRLIFPGASTQDQEAALVRPRRGTELVNLKTSSGEKVVALHGAALLPDGRPTHLPRGAAR